MGEEPEHSRKKSNAKTKGISFPKKTMLCHKVCRVKVREERNSGVCLAATGPKNRASVLGLVDWTSERSKKEYHQ